MTEGKKIKGRKRHITTDVEGNLLHVVVHAANIHDTVAGCVVIKGTLKRYNTIRGVSGDAGFKGTFVEYAESLGLTVDISERITPGWSILPKRWCVERSIGWYSNSRRLSKDYEITTWSEESHIYIASAFVLLNRLFPN
jgi:putative transposase